MEQVICSFEKEDVLEKETVSLFLKKVAAENNVKSNDLMKLMRSSLTGLKVKSFFYLNRFHQKIQGRKN